MTSYIEPEADHLAFWLYPADFIEGLEIGRRAGYQLCQQLGQNALNLDHHEFELEALEYSWTPGLPKVGVVQLTVNAVGRFVGIESVYNEVVLNKVRST